MRAGSKVLCAFFALVVVLGIPDARATAPLGVIDFGRSVDPAQLNIGEQPLAGPTNAAAATTKVLHAFSGYPQSANSNLIQDAGGNLYGTTMSGGPKGLGVFFKISAEGVLTVLHSFTGSDGANPWINLVRGNDGNFYGITARGGASNSGTIFRISAVGELTTLHSFSGSDGEYPVALTLGDDGLFYGATEGNFNSNDYGTVFKVSPDGALTTLHTFSSLEGNHPNGLTKANDGNFYGGTITGGANGVGTIFRITSTGTLTTLHTFSFFGPEGLGISPLALGTDGNLYGTAGGGGQNNTGTVLKITTAGAVSVLHAFSAVGTDGTNIDGVDPAAGVVQTSDGSLYGTAYQGGPHGMGTVFKLTSAGVLTVLHSFSRLSGANTNKDGAQPFALLTQGADGEIYGTTSRGGAIMQGTVYKIASSDTFTELQSLPSARIDGGDPEGLVLGTDGNFYGTTYSGGRNNVGSVYRITPMGTMTILHAFGPDLINANPPSPLVQGTDGNYYGTTAGGTPTSGTGPPNSGTIFKMTPAGAVSMLHAFNGTDGAFPHGLIEGPDGDFYGTTFNGGLAKRGTVFKITATGIFTSLYSFSGGADSAYPGAELTVGADGSLYGTTSGAGSTDLGSVFKVTTSGALTTLHLFGGTDGMSPESGLVATGSGDFIGVTYSGGATGNGTVYRINTAGTFTTLYSFSTLDSDNANVDGAHPQQTPTLGPDGNFYGVAYDGGPYGLGTVFKLTQSGKFTTVHAFHGRADGGNPSAPLVFGSDGKLYGTTHYGGFYDQGVVFQLTLP